MKTLKRNLLALFILIGVVVLCSCSSPPAAVEVGPASVRVMATRDFGQELIFDKTIQIDAGTTALDALKKVAQLETKYGGGFVSSINGISSEYGSADSKKKDWFFYINGMVSNVGAVDYALKGGEVEHWDFRDWSYHQFVPAIIGSYPQPFLSGFKSGVAPTLVVYEAIFEAEAEVLVDDLKQAGVSQVSAVGADRLSRESQEQSNLIVIAGPRNSLIAELNSLHKKLGFYAYIEAGKIIVLDGTGNPSREYSQNCGLIQATQNPWNPNGVGAGENVVWMVTGSDVNGIKSAAKVLINNHHELSYAFAVVINEGIIMKIP